MKKTSKKAAVMYVLCFFFLIFAIGWGFPFHQILDKERSVMLTSCE